LTHPSLSYVSGVSSEPLKYKTISESLHEAAATYPDNEAVVSLHQNIRHNYTNLNYRVTQVAAGLVSLGLNPGDRVGIWATNCVEWLIAQYATARAGLILVNINPAYKIAELEYVVNKVSCSAIIIERSFKTSSYVDMLRELAPNLFSDTLSETKLPSLGHGILIDDGAETDGLLGFSDLEKIGSEADITVLDTLRQTLQPEDPINIQFTSGTTGAPKGATLTHHNILNNGYFVGEGIQLTSEDRICVPVPLYHCFGMVMGNLAAMTHGAAVVYPSSGFNPEETLRAVEVEKCTALYGVPTMFIAMLASKDFETVDFSTLRTGIMAGSPCPVEIMKRVISDMKMFEVTNCYGMTETSPVSFQSHVDSSLEKRVSTVGVVHPHLEVKVVDEVGKVVPRGVQGELCTRGYSVMMEYWGDADETAKSIDPQGWMHTGDLAIIYEDDYANITGRASDVIIRGGENIYPKEIENQFLRHAAVQDVQVFGIPDQKFGEVSCAFLVLKDGENVTGEEIIDWLREQIAHYKIPKYVRVVEDYPMTVTGKAQKFLMRQSMMDDLNIANIRTA